MFKRVTLALIATFTLIAVFGFGYDYFSRYKSWRALSPAHISDASQWYISNRASDVGGIAAICVYALDCVGDRARLAIVSYPDQYDFEALKQLIWKRRFMGMCEGRTANLGLHLFRLQDSNGIWSRDHAIWSFYNDRFVPMHRNWSGGAFSEEPWERCSMDGATYLIQQGTLVGGAN